MTSLSLPQASQPRQKQTGELYLRLIYLSAFFGKTLVFYLLKKGGV
jgi:hypothetical protein